MTFMNAIPRTLSSSTFPLLIRWCINKQITCSQFSQCRMLTLNHCWRSQNNSTSTETFNLNYWKNTLQRRTQSPTDLEKSDTEEESPLQIMQNLIDMWRLSGKSVPNSVSAEEMQKLLTLPTKTSVLKALDRLMIKEKKKEKSKQKKLEKQMQREKSKMEMEESTKKVRTYIMKLYSSAEDCFYGWRNVQAMIHGQPLVFDMVYDKYMSKIEIENTISQLMMCIGANKTSVEPFHIHFCNLQPGGPYHKELLKNYQEAWNKLLITTTEKSHIDIFPRDQLVYLTADSPNVMKGFDPDKVYIVGAFVDKCQQPGVSLGIAKRLNIATARLPLDNHLKWSIGAKNLTLNQMTNILSSLQSNGDWKSALSYVPERKHSGFKQNLSNKSHMKKEQGSGFKEAKVQ